MPMSEPLPVEPSPDPITIWRPGSAYVELRLVRTSDSDDSTIDDAVITDASGFAHPSWLNRAHSSRTPTKVICSGGAPGPSSRITDRTGPALAYDLRGLLSQNGC